MSTQPKTFITPEQYLEIDSKAEIKSEYFNGEMFAMSEATWPHNLIVQHTALHLGLQLRSRPCSVVSSDMRMRVTTTGLYTYPDLIVVCGDPQFLDKRRTTLLDATAIVEVLSPSTEGYDRGRKFDHYQSIPSLTHYLLIASDRVHADLFTHGSDGKWSYFPADGSQGVIELSEIQCRLALSDLHEKVDLTSAAE